MLPSLPTPYQALPGSDTSAASRLPGGGHLGAEEGGAVSIPGPESGQQQLQQDRRRLLPLRRRRRRRRLKLVGGGLHAAERRALGALPGGVNLRRRRRLLHVGLDKKRHKKIRPRRQSARPPARSRSLTLCCACLCLPASAGGKAQEQDHRPDVPWTTSAGARAWSESHVHGGGSLFDLQTPIP